MTQNPINILPRLHMGCGESLHSKLLLGVQHLPRNDLSGRPQRNTTEHKISRGRTRG